MNDQDRRATSRTLPAITFTKRITDISRGVELRGWKQIAYIHSELRDRLSCRDARIRSLDGRAILDSNGLGRDIYRSLADKSAVIPIQRTLSAFMETI